jgi:NAD-specific glutamate dehydrogenase
MLYTDVGLAILLDDLEGPVLDVLFNFWVVNLAANETLGVKDSVFGVCCECVLGGISDSGGVCQ